VRKEVKCFMAAVDALAGTFGRNCEVVLHDFSKPDQSIVKIANEHVTRRNVGGPPTGLILSYIGKKTEDDFIVGYPTRARGGAELKSTTIFIKDKKKKVVGALCINLDITQYIAARNVLDEQCRTPGVTGGGKTKLVSEKFEPSIASLISDQLEHSIKKIGKPVVHMRKAEKLQVIKDLEKNGLFLIKGAAKRVSQDFGVSLPTIYKYLEEAR
jgi:predicted transcriptional regulator YheO